MLSIKFIAVVLLLFAGTAVDEFQERRQGEAPPLKSGTVTEPEELGTWDDAASLPDKDYLIVRRAKDLFSIPLVGSANPAKLKSAPAVENSQFVGTATDDDRVWLFLSCRDRAPFALDVRSGDVANFEVPGLKIPGSQSPGIQSHVVLPHVHAAILMIAGGDRATWPRDGNRPLYFWVDLAAGKVIRFPTGWDLDYFPANEQVAVFDAVQEKDFERRPLRAIDLGTGATVANVPDRRKQLTVPFIWTETEPVQPLYSYKPETGDTQYFAGLSTRGAATGIQIDTEGRRYLAEAKENDGFLGFRLRREGASRGEPSPYWTVRASEADKPERIGASVSDFALLANGRGVFVTTPAGKKPSSEAWGYAANKPSKWNVLEGIERLPPLEKEFAEANYIVDRMMIQLVSSIGTKSTDPLVLCLCTHQRADQRALVIGTETRSLKNVHWRRTILLTSTGQRYLVPEFLDQNLPDKIWLHHSGRIVFGRYAWNDGIDGKRVRQVQLKSTTLGFIRSK